MVLRSGFLLGNNLKIFCLDNILHNWEASVRYGAEKKIVKAQWHLPSLGDLKFNVDKRVAKGKVL